ncbi:MULTISPECIES: restriction endonuclease subunit S [unclassified Neptuniibacter]|uniref:restriction endonuclease subunit S n=1 Tax=unclassified Neptuniibacter TaxID=2630693 RepID=UPI0025FA4A04|nr:MULTISPECIES: restriction endonuclease subunit S [unclassified Neptuniibacter]|tara:strand:- start:560 stop:2296 length:1737 start_codon:yes stop_codon:yes gene_type:complete
MDMITDNIDIWTSAIKTRSSAGRGSSKKLDLYGIKKLRELILELAVRGKLVPQDPNDEPASVLLERIAAEKAQLVKEKKIKKQKPLPEIGADEKPFALPSGWDWIRLGELFNSIISGGTPSKREDSFWAGDIPWASVKDLGKQRYITKTEDYITQSGLDAGSKLADIGDILICTRMGLGKVGVASVPLAFNQDLKSVKLSSLVNVEHFLNTYSTIKIKGTGTTVAGIKQEQLLGYVVGLPPLSEQHRIVAKVDELMALCDQLEQQTEASIDAHATLVETLLTTLTNSADAAELEQNWTRLADHFDTLFTTEQSIDQLKQTVLQLAVMGKLVPQDPNDEPAAVLLERIAAEKARLIKEKKIKKQKLLPPISEDDKPFLLPEGWDLTYMQDITKVVTCGMASTPKYHESGRIFLSAKNVKPYKFMPDDHKFVDDETFRKITQNANPEKGDILLTRVGAGIGEAAVIDIEIEFAFYVSLTLVKPFLNQFNSYYLLHWLNSPEGVKKSLDNIYGAGVSQGNLNVNQVRSFEVPIPPLAEQNRIVAKVDHLMALCDQLKARLQQAQQTQLHLADALVDRAIGE